MCHNNDTIPVRILVILIVSINEGNVQSVENPRYESFNLSMAFPYSIIIYQTGGIAISFKSHSQASASPSIGLSFLLITEYYAWESFHVE